MIKITNNKSLSLLVVVFC